MDHIFNSRIARMSRRRACVVYQINAIGRRGPTAFLSQQGQPSTSLLFGFLQFGHWYYMFFMNDDDGILMTISVCHISQEERHGPWRMELWSW